jgi:hypothetical protein
MRAALRGQIRGSDAPLRSFSRTLGGFEPTGRQALGALHSDYAADAGADLARGAFISANAD